MSEVAEQITSAPSHILDLLPNKDVSFYEALSGQYREAKPFPHIMIDGLFDNAALNQVHAEVPRIDSSYWKRFDDHYQRKLATRGVDGMGPMTFALLQALNSAPFLQNLEALTGIEGLIPDPYYTGGGLHQIVPGGRLAVHADFNRHKKLHLDRRINLLLYLNKDWDESYGGHLELWDTAMTHCEQRILPLFNRMVIFSTTDFTYHGHPEPLTCPEGNSRKSIALYYYTNGRPASEVSEKHSTLFKDRPGVDEKSVLSCQSWWKKLFG